ncbi:MAG: sugar kinase [Bacteroidota bacterium]
MDVVTLGEAMVLFVPDRIGLLRYAHTFSRYVAGAESNLAVGMARLGHHVGWISRVGDDEFGQYVQAFLRGERVDVSGVKVDPDAPTGVFFKERRRSDSTRVYYYRKGSAASMLTPDDLDAAYIAQARYLHLTGITPALSAACKDTIMHALHIATEAGVPVSFDPNLRQKLWDTEAARAAYLDILPHVSLVLTSEEEAALITGTTKHTEAARILLEMGPSVVVIKLGAKGALGFTADEKVFAPVMPVDTVETVGAGDAFNAGFLSGQLRGWDLAASLKLGTILGALATTVPGDVDGLPDWEEIQPYLGGDRTIER